MRKGREPFRCGYCGRFIADKDLAASVPVPAPSFNPYEPPEEGYAHRSCVYAGASTDQEEGKAR